MSSLPADNECPGTPVPIARLKVKFCVYYQGIGSIERRLLTTEPSPDERPVRKHFFQLFQSHA
jgi:hypothetical protein